MEGFTYRNNDELRGIVPRVIENIFEYSSEDSVKIMVSYLQIYNEVITDLLKNDKRSLHVR